MLTDRKQESPDATSFFFKPDHPITWRAGQFLHYTLPHDFTDQRKISRYFSIASAPFENHVQITTRFMADSGSTFKKSLGRMPLGGIIQADDPEGDFVVNDPTEDMVWIAAGTGITAFRSILFDLDYRRLPVPVTLLYMNRDSHFIYKDELEAMEREHEEFKIHYFVSPKKVDLAALNKIVKDVKKPIFYISGPEPMVESYEKLLQSLGVLPHHVKTDYLPGYTWP